MHRFLLVCCLLWPCCCLIGRIFWLIDLFCLLTPYGLVMCMTHPFIGPKDLLAFYTWVEKGRWYCTNVPVYVDTWALSLHLLQCVLFHSCWHVCIVNCVCLYLCAREMKPVCHWQHFSPFLGICPFFCQQKIPKQTLVKNCWLELLPYMLNCVNTLCWMTKNRMY